MGLIRRRRDILVEWKVSDEQFFPYQSSLAYLSVARQECAPPPQG